MAKIRTDLEGVVVALDSNGTGITLYPGDTVPEGVEVGAHVLDGKPSKDAPKTKKTEPPAKPAAPAQPTELTAPPRAGKGSTVDAWREYATNATAAHGLNIDFPDDVKRDEIIDALTDAGIPVE